MAASSKSKWLRNVLIWFVINIVWSAGLVHSKNTFTQHLHKNMFIFFQNIFYKRNYVSNSDHKQVYNWGAQYHYCHFSKERLIWSNLFGTFLVPTNHEKKHTFDSRDMFYEPWLLGWEHAWTSGVHDKMAGRFQVFKLYCHKIPPNCATWAWLMNNASHVLHTCTGPVEP